MFDATSSIQIRNTMLESLYTEGHMIAEEKTHLSTPSFKY